MRPREPALAVPPGLEGALGPSGAHPRAEAMGRSLPHRVPAVHPRRSSPALQPRHGPCLPACAPTLCSHQLQQRGKSSTLTAPTRSCAVSCAGFVWKALDLHAHPGRQSRQTDRLADQRRAGADTTQPGKVQSSTTWWCMREGGGRDDRRGLLVHHLVLTRG